MTKIIKQKGFTLIELLIVIGILSILTVAMLVIMNPAEAQRKARDTQRIKDLSNLQAALEGWINDNPGSSLKTAMGGKIQTSNVTDTNCASGWLNIDVCGYLKKLPVDPRNQNTRVLVKGNGSADIKYAAYYVSVGDSTYHICTYLEAKANRRFLKDDGIDDSVYSIFSDADEAKETLTCP